MINTSDKLIYINIIFYMVYNLQVVQVGHGNKFSDIHQILQLDISFAIYIIYNIYYM
jgi:hypothetical protein